MRPKIIANSKQLSITIDRSCKQLIENHGDFSSSGLIGMQPRGVFFAERIHQRLTHMLPGVEIPFGKIDVSLYRDDFRIREKPIELKESAINFIVENRKIILIDDVLYTGRSIRAGLDALLDYGRPNKVELMILVHRIFNQHLPIAPNYIGKKANTIQSQMIKVKWKETDGKDEVLLITKEQKQ